MSYRKRISYRLPSATTLRVTAHGGVCSCSVPILDGPPPGFASIRGMPSDKGEPVSDGRSRQRFPKNLKL
jgi:hypothetical protein